MNTFLQRQSKTIYLLRNAVKYLFVPVFLFFSTHVQAQIYGNTVTNIYGFFNDAHALFLKINTGPSDSGDFTHYGIYDHPSLGEDCDVKFALYTDHATLDRPDMKLDEAYMGSPINGANNELAFTTPVTLAPSTTYWIGVRPDCDYGGGRIDGSEWADPPLRFISSYSFSSPWPDPVTGSMGSNGSVNNVTLWIVSNGQTLPVELISFDAKSENNFAKLSWEIAAEINNAGWNIQKSTNGFTWNTIGFVQGEGTVNEPQSYSYLDKSINESRAFYRLEQLDIDGEKKYSEVKTIQMLSTGISIYPTLAINNINVKWNKPESNSPYQIVNALGEVLQVGELNENLSIDISSLSTGFYFLNIKQEVFKFMKS